ncbi:DUF3427 domain-containing protein [Desulfosporosinus sp. Sb-LF]|nr:DUF3427 domain-containing protein [Desulfosporosinus sp. Sb-LF]
MITLVLTGAFWALRWVFFVLIHAGSGNSSSTMYQDYSISEELFRWQSQSRTTVESMTGQRYINQSVNGGRGRQINFVYSEKFITIF